MKYLKRKVYSIFNNVDYTNDHMLKLLTKELAKKAVVRFNTIGESRMLLCNKCILKINKYG